jgi:hypothetical protein
MEQKIEDKMTLRSPVNFEGKDYTEIQFDFDILNGKALREAEKRFIREGGTPGFGALNDTYCQCVAAEAAGMPFEFFDELKAPDYGEMTLLVRGFLLDLESTSEEPTKSEGSA